MVDKHNLTKQISILVICAILGFAICVQLKSVKIIRSQDTTIRGEELQKMLVAEKEKNSSLQDQIKQMQSTIENYRDSIEQTGSAYKGMENDLIRAENLAGLTDVYGSGIITTMSDAKANINSGPVENQIIHDSDVRSVVNELLAAGAEAISINDERVISTTAIRCVGPVILVNNTRSSTPFVIKAIGEPTALENALNLSGGIVSELRTWNIGVDIQKAERIDMSAYKGDVSFKHLTTVKKKQE